jgi:hypothetical protein
VVWWCQVGNGLHGIGFTASQILLFDNWISNPSNSWTQSKRVRVCWWQGERIFAPDIALAENFDGLWVQTVRTDGRLYEC